MQALVHGIGSGRDLEAGARAWRAAADLAPDDGAEEAAYHLYQEQRCHLAPGLLRLRVRARVRVRAAEAPPCAGPA